MAAVEQNVNLTSLEGETFEVSLEVVKLSEVVKIMVDQGGKQLPILHTYTNCLSVAQFILSLCVDPNITEPP